MKNSILGLAIAIVLTLPNFVFAGDRIFKPFKIATAMGYVFPKNIKSLYPLDFHFEPKYALSDNFWLGLRLNASILVQRPLLEDDYQALGMFSVVPFLDYSVVVSEKFRPFIGFGFGTYTYRQFYDGYEKDHTLDIKTTMGFCPRIGFEYKNFNLSYEHNFVPNGVSFSAIKAGYVIGGGLVEESY